jgi:hypothetical protein
LDLTWCRGVPLRLSQVRNTEGKRYTVYRSQIEKSQFCLAPSGAGWGIRIIELVMDGCIPVIIQDNITQPYEDVLPYRKFSLRVAEADIERLPEILRAVSQVIHTQGSHHAKGVI